MAWLMPIVTSFSHQEPEAQSTLHIKKEHERDYMGRSWLEAIPADLRYQCQLAPTVLLGMSRSG